MQQLDIIYQDQYLVAINKPTGLLVHKSFIDRHETRFALQMLRDQLGQYVYPVHRLDKPTSGVLLFALSSDVARALSEQFFNQQVQKHYLAIVRGYCPEGGIIDHPLKEKLDKISDKRSQKDKPAKPAISHYTRLSTVEIPYKVDRYPHSRYSLVAVQPKTGRKHQIRRHLKHIGHPIIGDAKHGKGVHNRFFQDHYQCHRLMLACTTMHLNHPIDNTELSLKAPLDSTFNRQLAAFGWITPSL